MCAFNFALVDIDNAIGQEKQLKRQLWKILTAHGENPGQSVGRLGEVLPIITQVSILIKA